MGKQLATIMGDNPGTKSKTVEIWLWKSGSFS